MTTEMHPRRKQRRSAFGQLVAFTLIWALLVLVFGIAAVIVALNAFPADSSSSTAPLSGGISSWIGGGNTRFEVAASSPAMIVITGSTALATVLAIWLAQRFLHGPALLDLGLRPRPGWLTDVAIGLALGPLMFGFILLVLYLAGWASVGPGTIDGRGLLIAFITYVLVAFSEESFSRGWMLQVLERGYSTRTAVLGSAAVFAALHGFNPDFSLPALLGLLLAGVLLARAYLVTRQLWLPMAFHLSWNYSEGPLYGFPVSGLPGEGLLTVTPTGPDLVSGGAFGPEAGLILIVGMVPVALALALLARRRRRAPLPSP